MDTNKFVSHPACVLDDPIRRISPEQRLCILKMRSVNADRQRIFHALTVPEYIETWFSAPGALTNRTVVRRRDDFFSIAYSCAESEQFRILCLYRVCRRSKLLFTWRHDNPLDKS